MQVPAADRTMAFIGYLPFLPFFILPIKLRKRSLFAQFHGRQAFVLWLLWAAIVVAVTAVMFFAQPGPTPSIYIWGVAALATIVYLAMTVIAILKVLLGERYRMPVVADVALLLKL